MGQSKAIGSKATSALAVAALVAVLSREAPASSQERGERLSPGLPDADALRPEDLLRSPLPVELRSVAPPGESPDPFRVPPAFFSTPDEAAWDSLLAIPRRFLDGALDFVSRRLPDPAETLWAGPEIDTPLVLRLLRVRIAGSDEDLFRRFLDEWLHGQRNYLMGFQEKIGKAEPAALEPSRFLRRQRKIAWNALKSVYFDRYQVEAREALRRTNFGIEEWHGIDYAILPPALAAYVACHGFDQRFSVGPLRLSIRMEPLAEWFGLRQDLTAGLVVECRPKDFPLALLAAAGVHDRQMELDFIGIGTEMGVMVQALRRADDP